MDLGHWSVIDIETTGINPGVDEIIDLGFLQFEGTKLVRKFSSLVRPAHEISPFIAKLTGITNKMLGLAPLWDKVEIDAWGKELTAEDILEQRNNPAD